MLEDQKQSERREAKENYGGVQEIEKAVYWKFFQIIYGKTSLQSRRSSPRNILRTQKLSLHSWRAWRTNGSRVRRRLSLPRHLKKLPKTLRLIHDLRSPHPLHFIPCWFSHWRISRLLSWSKRRSPKKKRRTGLSWHDFYPLTSPSSSMSTTPIKKKRNRLARAMRLSMFLEEILSRMEYQLDLRTGNHIYRTKNDIILTEEIHKIMRGSMYPKTFTDAHHRS